MSKKFGTFGGVFTPSILTILGVIMYLRLGWVVGQAGIYVVLGIILLAHVISISTGLTLSSIATDKKIKTGGIYYMLSRSLGLPIGGAIGITLFVGTAFSIALYVVGFVENFISIEAISNFLGMTANANTTRIIGSIVIISLVILAYISTSIAIKAQYFILGAIALSLLSIIIGILNQPDTQQITTSLNVAVESPDFIVLFAIFFPAVTGFTAGVAMSGDLESPKTSIPFGTLSAIGVGLVVYLGLALFFGLYVDRELLINDTNFLVKIAWFSPLVIAGIWGATLSSALGGLLGAPRILQAMSIDRLTPKIFAKGKGGSNEPRQALIFTFIIAELGILIGELDVIASIVSMFYIAAYGFINLAYVLEKWANPDFRPSLKISKWIGIIGFVASMGVMFKINTLAMAVSLLIIFGIYIILKRKEIQGNMSNVWQSVWTSLARSSLHKINQNPLNEKNWEPNIILYSGGTNKRPHLLELGSNFVGDHGFLSNFDLQVKDDSRFLFAKKDQNINSVSSEKYPGVFTRQQSVNNIYDGMEMIAQTYGFSGVEPNTIMMGWAKQSNDPIRFIQSINNLVELDMNVLLVDYDTKRGFGKHKKIDVWWRGGSRNGNLALYFSKFLLNSDAWEGAKIRLIIVNDKSELSASIYESSRNILENLRIAATIVVIDNEIEQRSFYEIIEKESLNSDLTFLGFPLLETGNEQDFVDQTNRLCQNIGTVVLIKSSSIFEEMHLGELLIQESTEVYLSKNADQKIIDKPDNPKDVKLAKHFEDFATHMQLPQSEFLNRGLNIFAEFHSNQIQQLYDIVDHSFQNLGNRLESHQTPSNFKKVIVAQHNLLLRAQNKYFTELKKNQIPKIINTLEIDIQKYALDILNIIKGIPTRIKIEIHKDQVLKDTSTDKATSKAKKRLKVLFLISKKIPYFVNFQSLANNHYPQKAFKNIYQTLIEFDQMNYKMGNALNNSMQNISDIFEKLKIEQFETNLPSKEDLDEKQAQIHKLIEGLNDNLTENIRSIEHHAIENQLKDLNNFSNQLNSLFPNAYENNSIDYYIQAKQVKKQLIAFPEQYNNNLKLIYNQSILNNGLLQFEQQARLYLSQEYSDLVQNIKQDCLQPIVHLQKGIHSLKAKNQANKNAVSDLIKNYALNSEHSVSQQLLDINDIRYKKIKTAADIFPENLELYPHSIRKDDLVNYFKPMESVNASVNRTVDYLIEKEVGDHLREFLFKFGPELQVLKNRFNNLLRQISLFDEKSTENDDSIDWDTFIMLTLDKLSGLELAFEDKKTELSAFFESRQLDIKKALQLHPFISNLTGLKQYIRVQTQKREFERLRVQIKRINTFLENQLNKLWYNQSTGLILARKLSKAMLRKETRVDDLLAFKDKVSVPSSILKKLPDYYKQLFLRKHFYLKDFWVGRETEFESAKKSFKHFKNGYKGGIIVIGERASGKSFFLNQLLNQISVQGDIYHLTTPYTGSISPADLLSSFQSATEKTGTFADLMKAVPEESVFVIDDLELWWEKSRNGMRVIDQCMKLIEQFSDKHIFLFACNINAFQLINHYRKIESNFINLIELAPLNAKQIKEAILKRHTSSGMQFQLKNRSETAIRSWQSARLFSSYFNYSEGNIGVALQSWVTHIESVENNTLNIKRPSQPSLSIFNYLETEWMLFIMQFILHKRMNMNKLSRVTQEDESRIQLKVNILKRAGILYQMADGILELNPYVIPFLRKVLIKRQLL